MTPNEGTELLATSNEGLERFRVDGADRSIRTVDLDKMEDVCRAIISEENGLVNNRITWFLNFQGFLFAAASLSSTNEEFIIAISVPGMLSGVSALYSVSEAQRAIRNMKNVMNII